MSTIFSETDPRGRKEYQCYLCARNIPVGQKHVKVVGKTDGDFWSMRVHLKCHALTGKWDEGDWECHDPFEFRRHELKEEG